MRTLQRAEFITLFLSPQSRESQAGDRSFNVAEITLVHHIFMNLKSGEQRSAI